MAYYVAFLHPSSDGYSVAFPDVPGCVSHGATIAEAVRHAGEALEFHAEAEREDGRELPAPRAPEQIPSDPEEPEAARFLVALDEPARKAA